MKSSKYRWYSSNIPLDVEALYQKLNERRYSGSGRGFELIDYAKNRVLAKFIEKRVQNEVVIDPYGEESTFKSIQYIVFTAEFVVLGGGVVLVRIANPPRSIKGFLNLLDEMVDGRVVMSVVSIDIIAFYQFIQRLKNVRQLKVTKAVVCNIPFNRNTSAKIELTSSSNAIEEFREKYRSENFSLAKIALTSRISGEDAFVEVSQNGSIVCSEQFLDVVDNYVGASLRAS